MLLKVIKPYTRIRIGFIATELNIPASEVPPPAAVATPYDGARNPPSQPASPRAQPAPPRAQPAASWYLQVEPLLVALILDGQVDGHVDQLEQLLLLNKEPGNAKKYEALDKWGTQLMALQQTIFAKLN